MIARLFLKGHQMPLGSFRFIKTTLFSVILVSAPTFASSDNLQRKTFLQAEKHIWNNSSVTYQNLYKQLHYYPLQPYLDQKRLMNKMTLSSAPEITTFLKEYRSSPLDWPLRKKWLSYLAKRNKPVLFQNFFKATNDAELTCQYYRFQLQSGVAPSKILPKVTPLWLVGKSQPKVCDPLFKQWQKAGYRTNDIIWQRILLAADGGKHTLIPYLTLLLPKNEQYLAELWHKVRRDPSYVKRLSKFKNKTAREAAIVTYGLKRLIWRAPEQALDTYQLAQSLLPFSVQQQQQITLKFALALASKNHVDASQWLAKVDDKLFSGNLTQWYITDALRDQNWQNIKIKLLKLPKTAQQSLQWRYWYSRSLLATDQLEEGNKLLTELAQSRHYYGFLAASYLKKPANFQNIPLVVSAEEKALIIKNPAAKRAFELFALGRFHHARLEWNYWLSKLNDRDKLELLKLLMKCIGMTELYLL